MNKRSPEGKYTKQRFLSNNRIVYYSAETQYYLYHRKSEWVVSSLMKSELSNQMIKLQEIDINPPFKVGRALEDPFILFGNTHCSETKCPANGGCAKHWLSNAKGIASTISDMILDNSVILNCKGSA